MIKIKNVEDIKQVWLRGEFHKVTYSYINGKGGNHLLYHGEIIGGVGRTDLIVRSDGFVIKTNNKTNKLRSTEYYLYNPINKEWEYKEVIE